MPPHVLIDIPSRDFSWCESRLRDAGLAPYAATRTTVEWLHLDSAPDVTVEGHLKFRGEQFPFTWRQRPESAELQVMCMAGGRESQLSFLDELDRVFPDRERRVIEPPPPTFRDRFAETLALPVGCMLVVAVVAAILFLAGYGVFALLQRP